VATSDTSTITRRGRVEAFDDDVGLGTLVDLHDGARRRFHCTGVGDGSRHVGVGAEVSYRLAAGRHGHLEATDIWLLQPEP
jgi:cold shock CspA family protein